MSCKKVRPFLLPALVATTMSPAAVLATKFENQFTEFELPAQWQCSLEGAEWVCQNTDEKKKKDAIIVLAAKLKGDQDSLDQYLNYLKNGKTYQTKQGKPIKSEAKYSKTLNINGQPWVDALHYESEIPGFYTRYLATVKQDLGILITYSVNKAKYQQSINDFENLTRTLKVFRKSGGINAAPQSGTLFQNPQVPSTIGSETIFPGGMKPVQGGADPVPQPGSRRNLNPILVLLGSLALIGLILFARRSKKG